jgi:hypothetical protein
LRGFSYFALGFCGARGFGAVFMAVGFLAGAFLAGAFLAGALASTTGAGETVGATCAGASTLYGASATAGASAFGSGCLPNQFVINLNIVMSPMQLFISDHLLIKISKDVALQHK